VSWSEQHSDSLIDLEFVFSAVADFAPAGTGTVKTTAENEIEETDHDQSIICNLRVVVC